jgi:hypothetical protein
VVEGEIGLIDRRGGTPQGRVRPIFPVILIENAVAVPSTDGVTLVSSYVLYFIISHCTVLRQLCRRVPEPNTKRAKNMHIIDALQQFSDTVNELILQLYL